MKPEIYTPIYIVLVAGANYAFPFYLNGYMVCDSTFHYVSLFPVVVGEVLLHHPRDLPKPRHLEGHLGKRWWKATA